MDAVDGQALAEALRGVLGPVTVEGLTRLSGGASRETWSFDAAAADPDSDGPDSADRDNDGPRTELVLRRDPPGRPSEPGSMSREALVIGQALAAGLAVPEVLLATEEPALWGTAGLVMRRVAGETIARRILRDDGYRQARKVLVGQVAEFAAGLHRLPVPEDLPPVDPLASVRAELAAFDEVSPVFELALRTLEAERPPPRAPVVVHGDLRLGNLIVGPDGLRAVLDWELAHAGNPAEDLGWLCVKAWRFGVDAPAAGLGRREDLLAAYRAAGGADVALDELRWWETLGTLRWGVICMTQAQAHLSGAHRSVELAAIGRRTCEQEWDLLLLLAPEAAARAAQQRPRITGTARPGPAPHGRPTASELLEAVREFLTGQVMPASSGQLAFHARVAANVLDIVAREMELGPIPDSPHPPAGLPQLADNVAARLAVANPRYFDPAPPAP